MTAKQSRGHGKDWIASSQELLAMTEIGIHLTTFEARKEAHMKTVRFLTAAVLIAASGLALHMAQAQLAGTRRIDLQRHDLSAQGAR